MGRQLIVDQMFTIDEGQVAQEGDGCKEGRFEFFQSVVGVLHTLEQLPGACSEVFVALLKVEFPYRRPAGRCVRSYPWVGPMPRKVDDLVLSLQRLGSGIE